MAGGEKAKSSGEYGERIVEKLLNYIGWEHLDSGVTVPCIHEEKHSIGDKTSKKHGIDYVYQYKSCLRDFTRQDILVSVKCREGYPKKEETIRKVFKEFYEDLVFAGECYPASEVYKRRIAQTKKRITSGVIFWIDRSREDGREYESIIDQVAMVRLQENNIFDAITVVDNNRAQFLYEALSFVRQRYGEDNIEFFYIDTGLNNSNIEKKYSGKVMPVEYLSSDIIPLALTDANDNKFLLLIVKSEFEKDDLKRIIGLAQDLTRSWASKVVIAFPNYNEFEHKQLFMDAKREFDDSKFTKNIDVLTYRPDFRDEV